MALMGLEFEGDFEEGLKRFEQHVKEYVVIEGVAGAAKVFYDEAKLNTSGARGHPFIHSGRLHDSIYRVYSKDKSTSDLKVYEISWNKSKSKGAPHGHLIEFGTATAPAYPFLRPAFDRAQDAGKAALERMQQAMNEPPPAPTET